MVHAVVLPQSKPIHITAVRLVSNDVPKTSVTRPKQVKSIVTKPNLPNRRHINRSPSPKVSNSSPRVTAVKALLVNATQGFGLADLGVAAGIDVSTCWTEGL
uniref:Uncharacterized protein n=1 Tax=Tanacetum cinerariifolium TaxID=118510 RepID=A0A6L2LQ16_TANCI|nr:hypothetical protein [Tanacetum cinerariifolium]